MRRTRRRRSRPRSRTNRQIGSQMDWEKSLIWNLKITTTTTKTTKTTTTITTTTTMDRK